MSRTKREVTEFEGRVYSATKRIPRGKVTTYKKLAGAIGCGSSRAVGQALRRNPFAPVVPCHRVIRSDLTLGGFAGRTQGAFLRRKTTLLSKEGVEFAEGRLAEPKRVYTFR
jgi:methylated-DNA-[protein]-cysteine S-methyltransferase